MNNEQVASLLFVGWVEVTKPFGYAQGNAQQSIKLVLGFAIA